MFPTSSMPENIYFFKIAGERAYREFKSHTDDKVEAAKQWYRSYIPNLSSHEMARLISLCGVVGKGTPLVICMATSATDDADCIRIRILNGITTDSY